MIKKLATIGATTAFLALSALPVFASSDGGYCSQPGCGVSNSNTECAGHGAFGIYSHGYVPDNYDTPRAADGTQTGLNNSGLCGNRQGNLP